jgi:cellulose synthase/poly-beta-1,6-N-acetylglucosamine synthase-like glycosyltransferase
MRVAGRAAANAVLVVVGACALAVGVSGPSAEVAGLTGGPRIQGGASLGTFQPAPGQLGRWETPLIVLAVLLIVTGVGYGMGMLAASRRDPKGPRDGRKKLPAAGAAGPAGAAGAGQLLPRAGGDFFFVFMMPCLNEEKVILNSLQRLLSVPGDDFGVLVIDDGSDDRTVDVLSGVLGERVWLLSRKPPQARQGKGEALNAGVRYLVDSGYLADRDPANVVVVVVDADGRLDPQSIEQVRPYFADPSIGAVQIGVRINNREQSRLARMQDMEFVIYTEVFQRGRRHLGSVGLGGNGQFMRLSAMMSLGPSPWTRSLTDDLDLGVRLIAAGWRNEYCASVAVHQQGVVELRRLIRQRSRWFQGHLQSWKLIPLVLRRAPRRARADLLYHLSSPAILLIASLLSASFVLSLADGVARATQGRNPLGWWVASTYALTFGPALAFGFVYWLRERSNGVGLLRTAGFAHMYVCYTTMWYASGWWAVARTLRGRTGWAKTDRVTEAPPPAPQPGRPEPGRPEPGRPGRRPRRRVLVAAVAVVLAFAAGGTIVAGTGIARHPTARPWLPVFNGYGSTSIAGSGPHLTVSLRPAPAASRKDTHAALVVSAGSYDDFAATLNVRTRQQLRHGAAGAPNPWEVGWVVWHYTSNQRFYALTLQPTGWVLSKQDPAYPGHQRFLASGRTPLFRVGVPHSVGVVQAGNQITVSADGHLLTQFTDTQRPYLTGAFGMYCEDAHAQFDHIRLTQLPASPQASRSGAGSTP